MLLLVALSPLLATSMIIIYIQLKYRSLETSPEPLPFPGRRPGVKTMSEVMELLREIPFRPRLPRSIATLAMVFPDIIPRILDTNRVTAGIVYPYPKDFEPLVLESQDGTPICGLLALQPGDVKRPAIILVHGLFGNKNNSNILALALRAYYRWGFHVLVIDLRNFGDSSRFSEAPTSFGFRESDDVLATAQYLKSLDTVTTVGVCGTSMGAASTLLAAGRSRVDDPLSGGVVAVNGYGDARRTIEHLSTLRRATGEDLVNWLMLRFMLLVKTLMEGPRPISDLRAYFSEVSSQYYELSDDELYRKASPVRSMSKVEVPCLIIHAMDDRVVPVMEAEDLLAAAIDNPMVDELIVPTGGHVLYPITARNWYFEVLRVFFSYWAEFEPGGLRQYGIDTVNTTGNPDN